MLSLRDINANDYQRWQVSCCLFSFFRAASSSVAAIRLNHSASPGQEVSAIFFLSKTYILLFILAKLKLFYTKYGRQMLRLFSHIQHFRFIPFPLISYRTPTLAVLPEIGETAQGKSCASSQSCKGERSNILSAVPMSLSYYGQHILVETWLENRRGQFSCQRRRTFSHLHLENHPCPLRQAHTGGVLHQECAVLYALTQYAQACCITLAAFDQ